MKREEQNKKLKQLIAMTLAFVMSVVAFVFFETPVLARETSAALPTGAGSAHLKWEKKLGDAKTKHVTPPALSSDGTAIFVSAAGKLYKLDCKTGKTLAQTNIGGSSKYATIAPTVAGGKVFTGVENGKIACIDEKSMKLLWTRGEASGQTISPIIYADGKVLTGTFTGSKSFFCLDANSGAKLWSIPGSGEGFYWSGAFVQGDFVIFGEDEDENTGISQLRSVNIADGSIVDTMGIKGSARCTIAGDGEYMYLTTKDKLMYKTKIDANGRFVEMTPSSVPLSGASTQMPALTGGKALVGTAASKIDVIDTAQMKRIFQINTPGEAKGEMLIKKSGATTHVYATYNMEPGGIFYAAIGGSKINSSGTMFTPSRSQYCISPLIADRNGVVYYKNDSDYIMAVSKGVPLKKVALKKKAGKKKAKLSWKKVTAANGYEIYRATKKKGKYKKVKVIKKAKTIKWTNKRLKRGKKYFYKVRAFAKVSGEKYYGPYSKIVKVKVK